MGELETRYNEPANPGEPASNGDAGGAAGPVTP
jgi:hypothetical protein